MAIDRDPMCSKMIRVSDEVHGMIVQAKLIPQEPHNDCLKRIIAENNYLKRHYISEAPRESMYRDLHNFVLNPEIKDDGIRAIESHTTIWDATNPSNSRQPGDIIHHINGDHYDNRPDNLIKISQSEHGQLHKELNSKHDVKKATSPSASITMDVPDKVL